jgi:hypothetical protein
VTGGLPVYRIVLGGSDLASCEPAEVIRDLVVGGLRLDWNPFELCSFWNTITFLRQQVLLGADCWRLLIATRRNPPPSEKFLLNYKEWVVRLSPGEAVVARPDRFSALWGDGDLEWVDPYANASLYGNARTPDLQVDLEEDRLFSDAMRCYLRTLDRRQIASLGRGLSRGAVPLPRVFTEVRTVSASEATSMIQEWLEEPCLRHGPVGYFRDPSPPCSDFPHRF